MSDPVGHPVRMKNDVRTVRRDQLQLALPAAARPAAARPPRPCQRHRADWWFRQMRRVIDEGIDFRAPGVY